LADATVARRDVALPHAATIERTTRCQVALVLGIYRRYNYIVRISYDPAKRDKALAERGLDFEDAVEVFRGLTIEAEDTRKDYGEHRVLCFGLLSGPARGGRLHPAWLGAPHLQHAKGQRS
jgi:hypothetical protein